MSIVVTETNGVKAYNLSFGKTTSDFFEEARKKKSSLRYNTEFKNRIELIQNFGFETASNDLVLSEDKQYVVAAGIYKPSVKIFQLNEMSMKCSRGIDSEIIKIQMLGDDWKKFALACVDRHIEIHAQYGRHFKIRVPKVPRDICYNPFTCDLFSSCSSNEIFRLNLEEGRFLSTLQCTGAGINSLVFNDKLNVLQAGGEKGALNIFDYRMRELAGCVKINKDQDVTSMKMHKDGLLLAAGSDGGLMRLYDLRFSEPIFSKQHPYMVPVKSIEFNYTNNKILSADFKSMRIYDKNSGELFTTVEPNYNINKIVPYGDSGLIMLPCEDKRIGTYFIPGLGPAPKWCSFLDNLTEEMEENNTSEVYEEYKFLTLQELERLNGKHLIGSKFLKSYMHGFVVKSRMYDKLKLESSSFSYNKYKKDKLKNMLDEQMKNRIYVKNDKVRVNEGIIMKIREDGKQERMSKRQVKDQQAKESIIEDPRFKSMFEDKDFKIDEGSEAFKSRHPNARTKAAVETNDYQNDEDDYEDAQDGENDNVEFQDTEERYDKKAQTDVVRKGQVFSGLSYEDKQNLIGKYSRKIGKDKNSYNDRGRGGSGFRGRGGDSFRGRGGDSWRGRGGSSSLSRGQPSFGIRTNKSSRGGGGSGSKSFPGPQRKYI